MYSNIVYALYRIASSKINYLNIMINIHNNIGRLINFFQSKSFFMQ